jgi:hypothetical protein
MVFNYKRKTDRGNGWTEESMKLAFEAVKTHKLGIREAARKFSIPYATFRKHLIKNSTAVVIQNKPYLLSFFFSWITNKKYGMKEISNFAPKIFKEN